MSTFRGCFLHVLGVKKRLNLFLCVRTKKLHRIFNGFFLGLFTFSNVNVLHEGLSLQDWVFRLGFARFSVDSI